MKILHVSHSDSSGGAAIAARRLHLAQRSAGIDSRMMVIHRHGDDPTVDAPLGWSGHARMRAARFVSKRLARAVDRGDPGMRSLGLVPTGLGAAINRSDADIVHLHWVGGEAMSLGEIAAIEKPLVWTLHDLWPLRGADHYGDGTPDAAAGIDRWTWRRKRRLWRSLAVSLVCPSHWMVSRATGCTNFRIRHAEVVPNALDPAVFRPGDRQAARAALGLPVDARVLLVGAQDVTGDPRKGFDLLQAGLHALRARSGATDILLAVFGAAKGGGDVAGFPTYWLGPLGSDRAVARAYMAGDAFVAPSRMDNLPNTVMEALFCGLPCVAFATGGMPDMIVPGETGFLAKPFESESLADAVSCALAMPDSERTLIRKMTLERFNPADIVARHARLYSRVLAETSGLSVQ